ncbi:MAG: glycosyltransferase family 9 protein [Calditrichota bacterium]
MKLLGPSTLPPPQRILVSQLRRIGDVLLCSPAVRALARHFQDAQIDFLVESPAEEVVWCNPYIRKLIVPPTDSRLSTFLRVAHQIRRERYDWVIDFFSNPRSAQFASISGAPVRVGLDRFGRRWAYSHRIVEEASDRELYAVDLRLQILAKMGVPDAGRELEIYSDAADSEEAHRVDHVLEQLDRSRPVVALATGSSNPAKLYPPELTVQVMLGLLENGCALVVTSGPGESELAKAALHLLKKGVPYVPDARVPTLAALYRHASIYVGPDSAPKHIAAACEIPTVAFFGSGRPANWHDALNPRDVLIEAPCDLRPNCTGSDCARRGCLQKIPPEKIVQAVLALLKNK